jgi:hypothetical protein
MKPEVAILLADLAKNCFGCINKCSSQVDHEDGCLPPRYYTWDEWEDYLETLI